MFKKCARIPTLETERLILREMTAADADDLRPWFGLDEVYKYWGRAAGTGEKNPELMFIDARPNVRRKPADDFIWGVVDKSTGKICGVLEIFDVENRRLGKVGYRFDPRVWGKGFCTEALRRAVDFVFTETPLDRLHAEADVENLASNRVLVKCGFTREGRVRRGKMGARYCDYSIYGFIRDDYYS